MQLASALPELQLDQPACVAIGAFDGVHRGHQALIGGLTRHAHATGRIAVVLTFFPHPSVVLRGRRPSFYLSTPDEKAEYIAALGVDALVTQTFDQNFANVSAADYVALLVRHARLSELWCGADFALGHGRQGNVPYLQAEGARLGFTVAVQEPVLMEGEVISSTRIRQTLRDGAVDAAARYLGRPFRVTGQVIEGAKRGRTLGIPTANLAVSDEFAIPAVGVYACRARLAGGGVQSAVTNIGFRPTFNSAEPKPTVETHVLDYSGDLYGQSLTLEFIAHLRPEMKFTGVDALVAQIRQDIDVARKILVNSEQ